MYTKMWHPRELEHQQPKKKTKNTWKEAKKHNLGVNNIKKSGVTIHPGVSKYAGVNHATFEKFVKKKLVKIPNFWHFH